MMKNFSFALFLEEVESSLHDFYKMVGGWATPDDIWREGGDITFIYNGELFMDMRNPQSTHRDLLENLPELNKMLINLYGEMPEEYGIGIEDNERYINAKKRHIEGLAARYRNWEGLEQSLFGRLKNLSNTDFHGMYYKDLPSSVDLVTLVAFWNKDSEVYKKLLKGCIDALRKKGLLKSEVLISTPGLGTRHISNLGDLNFQLSAEEERKVDLHQRLHLMNPNEKKAAMEKLGLVAKDDRGSVRKKWQKGMRDIGMPGYINMSDWFVRRN